MTAAAVDRRHAHEVELCMEQSAIEHEVIRLDAEEHKFRGRADQIHRLRDQREHQLETVTHELSGLLDGARL